jgi:predicted AAA+ superfamily ATPase
MKLSRSLESAIVQALNREGCALLVGPYEVGKSSLARSIAELFGEGSLYLRGSKPEDRDFLAGKDGVLKNSGGKFVIIDEMHGFPDGFDLIRLEIEDARARGRQIGKFLLLGFASLETEQLAASKLGTRAPVFRLAPFDVSELPGYEPRDIGESRVYGAAEIPNDVPIGIPNDEISLQTLWVRGGFPESLLANDDDASFKWRERYLESLYARGYRHLNTTLSSSSVRNFWGRIASLQGSQLSSNKLPSEQRPCLSYFDDLGLIRQLQPWFSNEAKRYEKEPKVYIRDSGLLHCIRHRRSLTELKNDSSWGHSWEGFCIETLIRATDGRAKAFYYRSAADEEIDLVLEFAGDRRWAIEMKGESARLGPGFYAAIRDIGAVGQIVVRPIPESFEGEAARSMTLPDAVRLLRGVS